MGVGWVWGVGEHSGLNILGANSLGLIDPMANSPRVKNSKADYQGEPTVQDERSGGQTNSPGMKIPGRVWGGGRTVLG